MALLRVREGSQVCCNNRKNRITYLFGPRPSAMLQTVVDAPNSKKTDLRRARSALVNLAPTSTGSATAIALIFPGATFPQPLPACVR